MHLVPSDIPLKRKLTWHINWMSAPLVITSGGRMMILKSLEGTWADNYYPSHMLCDSSSQALTIRRSSSNMQPEEMISLDGMPTSCRTGYRADWFPLQGGHWGECKAGVHESNGARGHFSPVSIHVYTYEGSQTHRIDADLVHLKHLDVACQTQLKARVWTRSTSALMNDGMCCQICVHASKAIRLKPGTTRVTDIYLM